ncbi:hypothetical protein hmeg3_10910 [Herbaspirillum sp. meg3]|uniref:hypothetical protein n=1 Tax=Herbaspirillum sp. meg3 TaxID=2025949 RepID=UPI000B97D82E|nr:hypothetical protein [Herbaspirillum sp. meg3]ASU38749.1 hypothetical protein hmeg3_10910 [Herbaspirillum sp. meg3]
MKPSLSSVFSYCGAIALLTMLCGSASAQLIERHPFGYPPPVPDKPVVTTSANTCKCEVADTSGSACMIYMRTNAADWIAQNAPQTRLRSSNDGRYYDTPFALAASACAGRKVNASTVKVHWLDKKNAILEWK